MEIESGQRIRVHAIGYAHLDPIWLWDWREGCREDLATVRSAIIRIFEYSDFKMSFSSAALYLWIKKYDPDLFERIRKLVQIGRWEIVGGWWVESDVNLPSGESLLRQGFYGKQFFKQNFGVDCIVAFNPDSFGHPSTLPKILKHLGQFYYVFMRPENHEKQLPQDTFIWEGDDGSQIIATRIAYGYTCEKNCVQKVEQLIHDLQQEHQLADVMCFFGVGDHGGGPTRQAIEEIQQLKYNHYPHTINFGTILEYFMHLEPFRRHLSVIADELQHHARGCYSVNMPIKRLNRTCETQLLNTEKWCSVAYQILKCDFPNGSLKQAWEDVLLHQFHDVITGTSIRKGLQDATMYLNEALAICDRELFQALRQLASHITIEDEQGEFIVFNHLLWPYSGPVEIEYSHNTSEQREFLDATGRKIDYQDLQRSDLTPAERKRWVFCDTIPPLGYKIYHWGKIVKSALEPDAANPLKITPHSLENQFWQLEFSPHTGELIRLYDQQQAVEVIQSSAAVAKIIADPSDTWSHAISSFDNEIGRFQEPEFLVYETGPVRACLCIKTWFNHSSFEQKWRLYRDDPRIEVELKWNWQEQQKMLKYAFPLNLVQPVCYCDQPYGQIQRKADGQEQPFQQWVGVAGQTTTRNDEEIDYGVVFLNNGINSYHLDQNSLNLTLCRSAIYAHHDPACIDPNALYDYSDQGLHEVKLIIRPYAGSRIPPEIIRQAYELNTPPFVLIDFPHNGYLPKEIAFAEISAPNVIGTVYKKAQDGDELILRCYETAGQTTTAQLRMPYWRLAAEFTIKPYAINTYRIKIQGGLIKLLDSNALEE